MHTKTVTMPVTVEVRSELPLSDEVAINLAMSAIWFRRKFRDYLIPGNNVAVEADLSHEDCRVTEAKEPT
jgi:hypothetical protein